MDFTHQRKRLLTTDCRILEIGPEFKLLSRIDAKFGLNNLNAVVGLNYDLSGVSFVFPPQAGSKLDGITLGRLGANRESCLYLRFLIITTLRPAH
jgi:hypothetical protein